MPWRLKQGPKVPHDTLVIILSVKCTSQQMLMKSSKEYSGGLIYLQVTFFEFQATHENLYFDRN